MAAISTESTRRCIFCSITQTNEGIRATSINHERQEVTDVFLSCLICFNAWIKLMNTHPLTGYPLISYDIGTRGGRDTKDRNGTGATQYSLPSDLENLSDEVHAIWALFQIFFNPKRDPEIALLRHLVEMNGREGNAITNRLQNIRTINQVYSIWDEFEIPEYIQNSIEQESETLLDSDDDGDDSDSQSVNELPFDADGDIEMSPSTNNKI